MSTYKKIALVGFIALGLMAGAPLAFAQQEILDRTVSRLSVDQVEVRDALRALFKESKVSYTVAADVQGLVTADFRNVRLETALENILRQVDAAYRLEAGVVSVIKKEVPAPVTVTPQGTMTNPATRVTVRIPIKSIDPALLFLLLSGNLNLTLPPEISKTGGTAGFGGAGFGGGGGRGPGGGPGGSGGFGG